MTRGLGFFYDTFSSTRTWPGATRRGGTVLALHVDDRMLDDLAAFDVEILAGKADAGLMLESLERPLPASWQEQRRWLLGIKDGNAPPIRSRMMA